jgi:hypothetical protein
VSGPDLFLAQSIFFGGVLCFVIVARNFAGNNISQRTWCDGLVFFSGGVLLLYAWFSMVDIYFDYRLLNHLYVPFIFFMGPGTYLGFVLTVDAGFVLSRRHALFLCPVFCCSWPCRSPRQSIHLSSRINPYRISWGSLRSYSTMFS